MSVMVEEEVDLSVDVPPTGDMAVTIPLRTGGLDRYLKLVGDGAGPRIKCLDGSLTLVSPSLPHERGGDRLNEVVRNICKELDIDYFSGSSTLLRTPGQEDSGIEPDHCYWIEHVADALEVEGNLDLGRTPPPDLIIEVLVTNPPTQSLEVCLRLGIPEVWVHRPLRGKLQFLHLVDGKYVARKRSRAFPFLGPEDVLPWVQSREKEPDNRWDRRLREWIRTELAPRSGRG